MKKIIIAGLFLMLMFSYSFCQTRFFVCKAVKVTKWNKIKSWISSKVYDFRHSLAEWIADDYFGDY